MCFIFLTIAFDFVSITSLVQNNMQEYTNINTKVILRSSTGGKPEELVWFWFTLPRSRAKCTKQDVMRWKRASQHPLPMSRDATHNALHICPKYCLSRCHPVTSPVSKRAKNIGWTLRLVTSHRKLMIDAYARETPRRVRGGEGTAFLRWRHVWLLSSADFPLKTCRWCCTYSDGNTGSWVRVFNSKLQCVVRIKAHFTWNKKFWRRA